MHSQDLIKALRERPFRIHVFDGTVYDVHHPEMVMVGLSTAMVFFPPSGESPPAFERYETVALAHITRLVPVESESSSMSA